MVWVVLIIAILIGVMMASSSDNKKQRALSGQVDESANLKKLQSISMEDSNNQPIFDKLIEIYKSGEPLHENSIITKEEKKKLYEAIKNLPDGHDYDFLSALQTGLLISRDPRENEPTGIILKPNEKCYFKTKNCILNTIQKIYKTVNYGGIRTNMGAFRAGSFMINSKDVEGYSAFGAGSCYVTNQRIVFTTDDNKNKVIPIKSVLSYATFEENAVLINIANATPVVFNFPCNGMFGISSKPGFEGLAFFYDDKMSFLYALDKVLNEE